MKPEFVTLHINGRTHTLALAPNVTLLHALRDLGYVDVKCGCEQGDCGACAVMLDGVAVNSCLVLVGQADGYQIVTAAGLGWSTAPPAARGVRRLRGDPVRLLHARLRHRGLRRCSIAHRTPPKPRFARRSQATFAGARDTGRSWKRFRSRQSGWQMANSRW